MAVLASITHEKGIDPEIGALIEKATADMESLCADKEIEDLTTAKRVLELEKEAYQKRVCIPSELAARKAQLETSANHAFGSR
jgi:Zn-dependent M32 family carboxypeptidase